MAGVFKLGQWFRAVSPAVIHGMLAGIGVLIFASQFHVMVDDKPKENGIRNLITIPQAIAKGLPLAGIEYAGAARIPHGVAARKSAHCIRGRLRFATRSPRRGRRDRKARKTTSVAATPEFATQQAAITASVQQVAERMCRISGPSLSNPTKTDEAAQLAVATK